jgi:hypothetical protein
VYLNKLGMQTFSLSLVYKLSRVRITTFTLYSQYFSFRPWLTTAVEIFTYISCASFSIYILSALFHKKQKQYKLTWNINYGQSIIRPKQV